MIRTTVRLTLFLAAGLAFLSASALAHHSFAANFNTDESTTITGVVTEFWFANPHTRIYLQVTNDAGEVEEWMAEGAGRNVLIRRGWTDDSIQPGTELIIEGNPSRDGKNSVGWNRLTLVDGTPVGP